MRDFTGTNLTYTSYHDGVKDVFSSRPVLEEFYLDGTIKTKTITSNHKHDWSIVISYNNNLAETIKTVDTEPHMSLCH